MLGLAGLSLIGCKETTSSENIRTRGIAMITEVIARSATRAHVRTELRVGGDESNTFVILEGGDELVADADGEEQVMETVSEGVYETVFDDVGGGTEITIRLERDGDDDAPGNSGVLPEPFDITSVFDEPVSRGEESMEITWEPSGEDDDMDISFSDEAGDSCIFDLNDDIPGDPGSYLLEPETLRSTDSNDPESCDARVDILRTRDGSTDDALDGESSFVLQQIRTIMFVSAP
jgi:hypothetical protein